MMLKLSVTASALDYISKCHSVLSLVGAKTGGRGIPHSALLRF